MSDDLREKIFYNLNQKETGELLEIWKTNDHDAWTDTAFDVIREILLERLGELPPQDEPTDEPSKMEPAEDNKEKEEDEGETGETTVLSSFKREISMIGVFLRKGWRIIWKEKTFWLFAALYAVVEVFSIAWLHTNLQLLKTILFITYIASFPVMYISTIGITYIAYRVALGEPVTIKKTFLVVRKSFWRVVGLSFLFLIAIAPCICSILYLLVTQHEQPQNYSLAFFLVIFPLGIFSAMEQFPVAEIVINDSGIRKSLKIAWAVFTRHFVVLALTGVILAGLLQIVNFAIRIIMLLILSIFDRTVLANFDFITPSLSLTNNGFYQLVNTVGSAIWFIYSTSVFVLAYVKYADIKAEEKNPPMTDTTPLPGPPPPPSDEIIAELLTEWVDPVTEEPPGTHYCLYPTPARGAGTQGSYLVYLPPSYNTASSRRFPVIYWLHGGFGNARQGAWAVEYYDAAMRSGVMPEAILILAQALPVGWYVDSKDRRLPIEQVIMHDLLPHVDAAYRSIPHPAGRGLEGHSMGGFGALHLGLKYPGMFGAISAVAPSILRDLSAEPIYRTSYTFDGDQAYYEEVGPWRLARLNAPILKLKKTRLRILSGAQDSHLQPTLHEFHDWLAGLGIPHSFVEVPGAGHDYADILQGHGAENFAFWSGAF